MMECRADAQREFASARTIIQDLGNNIPEGKLRDHFYIPPSQNLHGFPDVLDDGFSYDNDKSSK